MKIISLAYSCDSDDAFMVHHMKESHLEKYQVNYVADDIEILNEKALSGCYDISAVSMGVLPLIKDEYDLMPIGASVGQKFGPAIIANPGKSLSQLKKIAVPGKNTSAYLAACAVLKPFDPVFTSFDNVAKLVKENKVDGGILIHELQINPQAEGFEKLADLGVLWNQKYDCPLPLGGIVIRKSLGKEVIEDLTQIYRSSIKWALENREQALVIANKAAKAQLSDNLQDKYIHMYVNEDSLELSPKLNKGMEILFSQRNDL